MDADQFFRIAKALADPRRFEIFEAVAAESECGCGHLRDRFDITQPTISHHLKELTTAGLVEPRREGQFVFYRARPAMLRAYLDEVQRRLSCDNDSGRQHATGSTRRAPGSTPPSTPSPSEAA